MKKIVVLFFILFSVQMFYSHSAKSLELSYSIDKKELTVKALHKVSNEKKHFIDLLIVMVNGNKVFEQKYTAQSDKYEHLVFIKVDAKAGDKITVDSNCNLGGKRRAELIVK